MLNHASFGAVPLQVQKVQRDYQDRWMCHADAWYFGGKLEESMLDAARVVGEHIGAKEEEVCLLGNATDATITILHRWNRKLQESSSSSSVISLNYAYRANKIALGYYIEPHADVIFTEVPFPYRSFDSSFFPTVLENLERDLRKHRPRYALLEHIHSQPAICLPIEDMVQLCRDYGVEEIAVDGAHGVGSIPDLDVPSIGADFYYSNLHKWGSYLSPFPYLSALFFKQTPYRFQPPHINRSICTRRYDEIDHTSDRVLVTWYGFEKRISVYRNT